MSEAHVLSPDDWLSQEWEGTSEGDGLWISAKRYTITEAYEKLKQQFGVRNMPLDEINLAWIKYGYEPDDVDHYGEEMYWRQPYKRGSYPIWYIDPPVIEKYGGVE